LFQIIKWIATLATLPPTNPRMTTHNHTSKTKLYNRIPQPLEEKRICDRGSF